MELKRVKSLLKKLSIELSADFPHYMYYGFTYQLFS